VTPPCSALAATLRGGKVEAMHSGRGSHTGHPRSTATILKRKGLLAFRPIALAGVLSDVVFSESLQPMGLDPGAPPTEPPARYRRNALRGFGCLPGFGCHPDSSRHEGDSLHTRSVCWSGRLRKVCSKLSGSTASKWQLHSAVAQCATRPAAASPDRPLDLRSCASLVQASPVVGRKEVGANRGSRGVFGDLLYHPRSLPRKS
jgi:hypothetical protein